ncbi:hypothetical protein FRB99_001231 [Tulasnella sp. 403]|nr:hypothetical protein FRB99_001231 [Tulasnella sp. 403]
MAQINGAAEDQVSLMSTMSTHPSPSTVTSTSQVSPDLQNKPLICSLVSEVIKRLRAMTLKLLPVQVEVSTLVDPTSRVITPNVIAAYSKAAGDFPDALPYCLLAARQSFMWDANTNPADYDENVSRGKSLQQSENPP